MFNVYVRVDNKNSCTLITRKESEESAIAFADDMAARVSPWIELEVWKETDRDNPFRYSVSGTGTCG